MTLAPEGGAHQSMIEPLIGIGQPGLIAFEPAYADELAVLLRWALEEIQREDGRFGLFPALDPADRPARAHARRGARRGRSSPARIGCASRQSGAELAIAYCGAVAPEALAAHEAILEDVPGAGLLAITSPGSLYRDWQESLRTGEAGDRRSVCWRGCVRARRSSPSPMVTRRRCPGSARWRGNADRPARRRPVRPVRRHPGPLPRVRDRRGRHHRRRGARLSAGRPSDLNAVIAPLGRIDPPPFIAARRASRRGAPAISASARCRSACRHRP